MTAGPPAGNPAFPVAIVEPTTLLGRDVRAALTERKFPASRVHLFHQAPDETGLLTADDDEVAYVAPLTHDALQTSRIAFLCGSAADTSRFLATRTDGALAIDLSGVRNGQALVVPSEGGEARTLPSGELFLTPHPVAFVLFETIRLVETLAPVAGVTAAVDRPVSELGKAALDELFQQALALATFRPIPKDVLETQGAFNSWVPPDSRAFETRVADDLEALLGRPIPHGDSLGSQRRLSRPLPAHRAAPRRGRSERGRASRELPRAEARLRRRRPRGSLRPGGSGRTGRDAAPPVRDVGPARGAHARGRPPEARGGASRRAARRAGRARARLAGTLTDRMSPRSGRRPDCSSRVTAPALACSGIGARLAETLLRNSCSPAPTKPRLRSGAAAGAARAASTSGPPVTLPSGSVRRQLRKTRGCVPAARIGPDWFLSPGAKMFSNSRHTTALLELVGLYPSASDVSCSYRSKSPGFTSATVPPSTRI